MNKKLNVLFLSSWMPNRVTPTNGDFVERHAEASALHNRVTILHVQADPELRRKRFEIDQTGENPFKLVIYFRKNKIPVLGKVFNALYYLFTYLRGYRMISQKFGKPDIIHANIQYPIIFIVAILHFFHKIPFVLSENWTVYLTNRVPMKRITRRLMHHAGMILPVSLDLQKALKRHGFQGEYTIVPNSVDVSRFNFLPHSNVIPVFVHVSNMKEEHKNILGILHTAGRLAEKRTDFRIDMVGGYSEEQHETAQKLGLLNKIVFFHGKQDHKDVPAFLQKGDIFLLFSNYENQPCVISESLSCGLPVLTSDVGGNREHVNTQTGRLVSPGHEDDLLKGMLFMLDNYGNFDRETIRRYAVAHFSMEAVGKKFDEIYRRVLLADVKK